MNLGAILDKHGPMALALVVLGYLLITGQRDAREDRQSNAAVLLQQLEDVERACKSARP